MYERLYTGCCFNILQNTYRITINLYWKSRITDTNDSNKRQQKLITTYELLTLYIPGQCWRQPTDGVSAPLQVQVLPQNAAPNPKRRRSAATACPTTDNITQMTCHCSKQPALLLPQAPPPAISQLPYPQSILPILPLSYTPTTQFTVVLRWWTELQWLALPMFRNF